MEIVEFTQNNARIHQIEESCLSEFMAAHPGCIVNPDRVKVRGIDPHFWKRPKSGNVIEKMNEKERAAVLAHHAEHGVDNGAFSSNIKSANKKSFPWTRAIPWAIAAVEAVALIILLVNR